MSSANAEVHSSTRDETHTLRQNARRGRGGGARARRRRRGGRASGRVTGNSNDSSATSSARRTLTLNIAAANRFIQRGNDI